MEVCYVITFKPQEVRLYSAELVVVTEREKFIMPVTALGHRAALDFPDEVVYRTHGPAARGRGLPTMYYYAFPSGVRPMMIEESEGEGGGLIRMDADSTERTGPGHGHGQRWEGTPRTAEKQEPVMTTMMRHSGREDDGGGWFRARHGNMRGDTTLILTEGVACLIENVEKWISLPAVCQRLRRHSKQRYVNEEECRDVDLGKSTCSCSLEPGLTPVYPPATMDRRPWKPGKI